MLIGIALVFAAIVIFEHPDLTLSEPSIGHGLNQQFQLSLARPQNVLIGSGLLLMATLIIGVAVKPWLVTERPFTEKGLLHWPWSAFERQDAILLAAGFAVFVVLIIFMLKADTSAWLVLLWLVPAGLFLYVTIGLDRRSGVLAGFHMPYTDWLCLVALLVFGLAVMSWQLDQIPNLVIGDEAGFYERIEGALAGLEAQSFFGPGVYTYPLSSSIFQTGIVSVFGPNLWSWRFSSVLPAIFTIIPLYIFTRSAFGRPVAITASLTMISLPYLLAYARMGYNNAQAIPVVAVALTCIYASVRRRSLGLACFAGIAAGLGFYTYTAGRLAAVSAGLFVAMLVIYQIACSVRMRSNALERRKALRRSVFLIGIGAVFTVTTLVVALPGIVYTNTTEPGLFNHKMFESLFPNVFYVRSLFPSESLFRDFPPITAGEQTLFIRFDLYAILVVRGIVRTLAAFHISEMNAELFMVGPLTGIPGSAFYTIGLIVAFRQIRHLGYALLVLWWACAALLLSVVNTFPPRPQHMIPIVPVIAILIGIGIMVCARFAAHLVSLVLRLLRRNSSHIRERAACATAAAFVLMIVVTGIHTYFVTMPSYYPRDLEMVMSFDAMAAREPEHIIYLTSQAGMHQWSPWMIASFAPEVEFDLVNLSAPGNLPAALRGDLPVTFYFEDADYAAVARLMRCLMSEFEPVRGEILNGDRPAWTFTLEPAVHLRDIHQCALASVEE